MINQPIQSLERLLKELPGASVSGAPAQGITISSIASDSRKVGRGSLFVAVRGTQTDGHKFIDTALGSGAIAVVCEDLPANPSPDVTWIKVADSAQALGLLASAYYGHPSRRFTLVGVTGTNGKTTIATLLYDLARLLGKKAGLLSTVVNKIGDESVAATHTTPDPLELQALMARMMEAGCTFAAMEVSSHAAHQKRIAGLDFDGGIFTNLTRDHLDYHGSVANYLKAKQSFFDSLKPEAFALTNADDRNGLIMTQNTRARKATYGLHGNTDFRGRLIEDRIDGMLLSLNGREVDFMFCGRFNAYNLTAVYGAGRLLGVADEDLLPAMSALTPVAGRFQPFASEDGVTAIVDYAHTPDALINVLDTLNDLKTEFGRIITVFGCGGDRDKGKRPMMAAEAAHRSNYVILTSDNPRSEDPMAIIDDMLEGLDPDANERTTVEPDRRAAIRTAVLLARPGDIILVAGKGHETYQIIGHETSHFDDREEVKTALALRTHK